MIIFIKNVVLAVIGLSGGIAVAGGVFALITVLGIIPRFADRAGCADHVYRLELMIALGGTVGSILTVYNVKIPLGYFLLVIGGGFAGIFTGCFAMALAENLRVIPILFQRIKLNRGIPWVILMIALGKGLGTFFQLVIAP